MSLQALTFRLRRHLEIVLVAVVASSLAWNPSPADTAATEPATPARPTGVLSVPGFVLSQSLVSGGAGVAWGEAYGDAGSDLAITIPGADNVWYFSDGGTLLAGGALESQDETKAAAWGDYDNDGLLDFVGVASFGLPPLVVYHNLGAGNFVETTADVFPSLPSQCRGVGWADFDRDGDLDLCVGRQGGSGASLYVNGGGTSLTESAGFEPATGVAWGDYDNDRWPDLYLADLSGSSHLYRNVMGTFVDVTTPALGNLGGKGHHAEWADFDNDGDLDLYVGNSTVGGGATSRLYRNDNLTAAGFVNLTIESGLIADRGTAAWGDFDNDGLIDLYAQHGTGNRLWRNIGGGSFVDMTSAPLGLVADGGVAWGDVNNDGYLDLAVANSTGPTSIFRNDGSFNHWLKVDLAGTESNRFGIGARVEVVTGGLRQMREVSASAGYLGENSITAEFGLGLATVIDSLIVTWPTGARHAVSPVPAVDSRVVVVETDPAGVGDAPSGTAFLALGPNPFSRSTTLRYTLARAEHVRIEVFDPSGRVVRTLASRSESAGRHEFAWDGRSDRGDRVPAGIYLCRLRAGSFEATRRMVFAP